MEVIPRTAKILKILEPIRFPSEMAFSFLTIAIIDAANSGTLVPIETTVTAITRSVTPKSLAKVVAPFINNLDYELIVDVYTESLQTTSAGASIAFTGITLNDGNMGFYNYDVADYNSNYKLVFDGKITTNSPSWPFSDGPALKVFNGVTTTWVKPTLITGWPASFENTTTIYDVHAEFEVEASVVTLLAIGNEPESSSFNVKSVPPSTLKIYKAI